MLTRAVLVSVLAVGCSMGAAAVAEEPEQTGPSHSRDLYVIRVFTLQGIDLREAMMLVRGEEIRKAVIVPARGALVVADLSDKVARSQDLLTQKGVLVRAAEPHGPLYLEEYGKSPVEMRAFRMQSDGMDPAVTLLHAIYGLREVDKSDETTLTARAATPLLDASEALFRELHLTAEPAGGSKDP